MKLEKRSIRNYGFGLLGLILFLIILKYDLAISLIINSWRTPWLDSIMFFVEKVSMPVIVLVPFIFVLMNKKWRTVKNWTISLLGAYAISLLIKTIVARERPFSLGLDTPTELIEPGYNTWDFSFPSNHASTSWASFFFIPGRFWRISWILICVLIMFSRVYFGLHYLSDVIFGAVIGIMVSYLLSKYGNKMLEIRALDRFKYRRSKRK